MAALLTAGAHAQGFKDYTRRAPLTIHNNTGAATPSPTSVEVLVPPDAANTRPDLLDLRVGYDNGGTVQEINSKIFHDVVTTPPTLTENLNAGTTSYAGLPTGTQLSFSGSDDSAVTVTLPFDFPFVDGTTNQLTIGIDGYAAPGASDPGRSDDPGAAKTARIIMAWDSDMAITGGGEQGVWYATDNGGAGGAQRAIVRWQVQESASGPVIAKVAMILTANGDIRLVYGSPVDQPSAGVTGYAPVKVGVGVGDASVSKVNTPTVSFTGHADILYTQSLGSRTNMSRVVFRLQQPIAAGGTSTGQYFLYYGNSSPTLSALRDVKSVFDYTVDFKSAANVVGQPAPDWDVQTGNTVTVENYMGGKVGVLRRGTQNHPRATVKATAMPAFLNSEMLAHIAPKGGGEREMAPMSRVVSDPGDPNFQGGYGYAVDSFGSNSHLVSYVNPVTDENPADMGGVGDTLIADQYENILFRTNGQPGLLQGKNWTDGDPEPTGWMVSLNRADANPTHGGNPDPAWDQPGTTGMAGYVQDIAMDYIAMRELRDLSTSAGTGQTLTPTGPFIQGTVQSSKASLNPLANAQLHITGPGGYDQSFAVGPNGQYRLALPAGGSYTIVASAPFHTTTTVANVSPSASTQTNITLPYSGATFTGIVSDSISNQPYGGMTVVAVNSTGKWVGSAVSDATGHYTMMVQEVGNLSVAALSAGIASADPRSGKSARQAVTITADTVNPVNFRVAPPVNGDFEIPNQAATAPFGWSTTTFTAGTPPATYALTTAQNHTTGGRYSVSVTNPSSQFEAWIPSPPDFQWATVSPNANYTLSAWVYFTQTGQRARLRVRTLDATGADLNLAQPGGNGSAGYITAGAADAASGAQAPLNQWTKITVTVPANPSLAKLDVRLYAAGPAGGGIATGTIYFDDYAITAAPIATAAGKLVDADGNPVAGALIGPLTADDAFTNFTDPVVWNGPYAVSDENGNFTIYAAQEGDIPIAAFKLPAATNGVVPDYGFVISPADGKLHASATPGAPQTIHLLGATNVADGATANAVDDQGNTRNGTGGGVIASSVDNNLNPRWDSGAGNPASTDVTITYTLPSVQLVDQIETLWELADTTVSALDISSDGTTFSPAQYSLTTGSEGIPSGSLNYSSATEGRIDVIRFPSAQSIKAIRIHATGTRSGLTNYSIIELRALSLAIPPVIPLGNADVTKALRIAGGLDAATPADVTRLDVVKADGSAGQDGKITLLDAASIRKNIP
jgi:hypothetical protein